MTSVQNGGTRNVGGRGAEHQILFYALRRPLARSANQGGKKIALRGGGVTRKPIFPTPAPPSLAAVPGGGVQGGGAQSAVPGGGVNPTSMAQNDTHVALIILTTQMWGGGGGIIGGKNFFGPKFVFLPLRRQHSFLHKTKEPTRNPISPTLPPPSAGVHVASPPPPPPQSNFQVGQYSPDSTILSTSPNNFLSATSPDAVYQWRRAPDRSPSQHLLLPPLSVHCHVR